MKWMLAFTLIAAAGGGCSSGASVTPAAMQGTWGFYFVDTATVVDGLPSACGASYTFVMTQDGNNVSGTQLVAHDFLGRLSNTASAFCYALSNPSVRTTVVQTNTVLEHGVISGNNVDFQIGASSLHATGSLTVDSTGQQGFSGNATLSFNSPGGALIHLNAQWVAAHLTDQ